jgi:hypothetical protein
MITLNVLVMTAILLLDVLILLLIVMIIMPVLRIGVMMNKVVKTSKLTVILMIGVGNIVAIVILDVLVGPKSAMMIISVPLIVVILILLNVILSQSHVMMKMPVLPRNVMNILDIVNILK